MKAKKLFISMLSLMMFFSVISFQPKHIQANEELTVSFLEDHVLPDENLHLVIEGNTTDTLLIKWYRDGEHIAENENQLSYQVKDSDMQKIIKAVVYHQDEEKELQMLISNLPVVYIDIENGAEVVQKDVYLDAEIRIQNSDTYEHLGKQYQGKTEIKGRGNSTWGLPKKPYRLKFDKKSDVLGMGKNKHWVLLANYYDTSLLRNTLAYNLAAALDMTYTATVHVDVVINGTKRGNYQLCEHIRIDDTRVDIFDWESFGEDCAEIIAESEQLDEDTMDDMADYLVEHLQYITSGEFTFQEKRYVLSDYDIEVPDINGGYLIEMDEQMDEVSCFKTPLEQPIMFKSPEFVKTNTEMFNYMKDMFSTFETAIQSAPNFMATYKEQQIHYTDLFDMQALIDYWLIQEVFYNQDGVRRSTYMYQDLDGKMTMGPVWDFDWSSGGMGEVQSTTQWFTWGHNNYQQKQQWYKFLVKDPYFLTLAYARYIEVRDEIQKMIDSIDDYQVYLLDSAAENQKRWGTGNFMSNSNKLKTWLTNHMTWMDEQMITRESFMQSIGSIVSNQFDVTIRYADDSPLAKTDKADGMVGYKQDVKVYTNAAYDVAVYVNGAYYGVIPQDEALILDYNELQLHKDGLNVITFAKKANEQADMSVSVSKTLIHEPADMISLEVTGNYQNQYVQGDQDFDPTGIIVHALMSDETKIDITDKVQFSGFDTSEVGNIQVKVEYQQLSTSISVDIIEPQVASFEVIGLDGYDLNEQIQLKDTKIIAHYVNDLTKDVTNLVQLEAVSFAQPGNYQVAFDYHGSEGNVSIVVCNYQGLQEKLDVIDAMINEAVAYEDDILEVLEAEINCGNDALSSLDWEYVNSEINSIEETIHWLQRPTSTIVLNATELDYKSVLLSWNKDEHANEYQIYRYDVDQQAWKLYKTTENNEITLSGLKTGVAYRYYVQAVNQITDTLAIEGQKSNEVSIATSLKGNVDLSIKKQGNTQFTLNWNLIDGATRYIIYRKNEDGAYKKVLTLGKTTTYTTSSMPQGTYYYKVRAARYDGKERVMSNSSNEVMAKSVFKKPVVKLTKVDSKTIKLTWDKVEGVTHYEIYRASSQTDAYKKIKTLTATTYETAYKKGNAYKVRGVRTYQNEKIYTLYSSAVIVR